MENNKIYMDRGKKRLTAVIAAIAAAACLTVTAGALTDWSFFSYFRQQYGENAENMTEYFVSNTSYEVLTETFEDYDFEVKGIAADEHVVFVALDITALNGKELASFNGMDILPDNIPVSFSAGAGFRWDSINEDNTQGIGIYDIDISEPLKAGAYLSLSSGEKFTDGEWEHIDGELTIHFNMPEIRTKDIEVNRTVKMPLVDVSSQTPGEWTNFDGEITINKAHISGISMTINCELPKNSTLDEIFENDKFFIRLDDGQKIGINRSSSSGVLVEGAFSETDVFKFAKPVDVDSIVSLNFGETEIPVK